MSETMHIEDAIARLCQVHLRDDDEIGWEIKMGATPIAGWQTEEYTAAWVAIPDAMMFNRRATHELMSPIPNVFRAINPTVAAEFYRLAQEDHHLAVLKTNLEHYPKTVAGVIEMLIQGILQQSQFVRHYEKMARDALSLQPMPMFIRSATSSDDSPNLTAGGTGGDK